MKFDDLLAQYLYENKTLNLQGLGTFTLEGRVSVPSEHDKGIYYPIEGLTFIHNTKVSIDEALVSFLVKKLGKIQPLVRSDLESYLSNVKQFINLGKPYTIEGVGTLHINNQGIYEFTPGNFLPAKEELNSPKEANENAYVQRENSSSTGKTFLVILIILASIAALAGMGWGVYILVNNDKPTEAVTPPAVDSLVSDTIAIDTSALTSLSTADSANYKMIFEITPLKSRAVSRSAQLQTLNIDAKFDSITSGERTQFRIYVNKWLATADTMRIRDSISRFFLRRVVVEKE